MRTSWRSTVDKDGGLPLFFYLESSAPRFSLSCIFFHCQGLPPVCFIDCVRTRFYPITFVAHRATVGYLPRCLFCHHRRGPTYSEQETLRLRVATRSPLCPLAIAHVYTVSPRTWRCAPFFLAGFLWITASKDFALFCRRGLAASSSHGGLFPEPVVF